MKRYGVRFFFAWLSLALAACGASDSTATTVDTAPPPKPSPTTTPDSGIADASTSPEASASGDSGITRFDDSAEEQKAIDDNWALRVTRAIEAWRLVRSHGREPGEGVLIAHTDTGISLHPEVGNHPHYPSPIAWGLGRDFVDGDAEPLHDFSAPNRIPPHGHGTETASVIVSPLGCPTATTTGPCVTGVAPAARLVPMRVSPAVVLLSGDRVAEAIDYAVTIKAHIVSLAMGSVTPMTKLHEAIDRALAAGLIVISAAGNFTGPVVVSPATHEGVVCVGGATPALEGWSGSANGDRVDISGPATEVRYAKTTEDKGVLTYGIGLAQGTSDATSITAGAAALFLSFHGRDALVARYGEAGVPRVFRALLKEYGYTTPPKWPNRGYGPGILDIVKLLEAPLPAKAP